MFNKELVCRNIVYLAKARGVKIGDLEHSIGVSSGYIAKLRSDNNRKTISIELLLAIAQKLAVSLDYLCNVECEGLTDVELDVLAFMEKIKKDTSLNVCKWIEESANSIINRIGHIGMALVGANFKYISLFRDSDNVVPTDNSYVLKIRKNEYLAIVKVNINNQVGKNAYELYVIAEDEKPQIKKICTTTNNYSSMYDRALEDLYQVAKISSKRLTLDFEISNYVKTFLSEPDDQHYNSK